MKESNLQKSLDMIDSSNYKLENEAYQNSFTEIKHLIWEVFRQY